MIECDEYIVDGVMGMMNQWLFHACSTC